MGLHRERGAYLNPAIPEAADYVVQGGRAGTNYAVDGIHFDDYFYPTTDPSIDVRSLQPAEKPTHRNMAGQRTAGQSCPRCRRAAADPTAPGVSPAGNPDND